MEVKNTIVFGLQNLYLEHIKEYHDKAPALPGVYIMLSERREVLYIGKAKNIKKRIASYILPEKHPPRIKLMLSKVSHIDFIITETDAEALLLEASMIKGQKPKYNIQLRDDKTFPYIAISSGGRIFKYRGKRRPEYKLFGPFASADRVKEMIRIVQKVFMLRTCTDQNFQSRKRPCIEYQLNRCSAPCVNLISDEEYKRSVRAAAAFLRGKTAEVRKQLNKEMEKASEALEFEKAAAVRDKIRVISAIEANNAFNNMEHESIDIFVIKEIDSTFCIYAFFIHNGQCYGENVKFFEEIDMDTEQEFLMRFVASFYVQDLPKKIMIDLNKENLNTLQKAFSAVTLLTPKDRSMKAIFEFVNQNAKNRLLEHLVNVRYYKAKLQDIAKLCKFDGEINTVEVYDNSHHAGANPVGAFIVAGINGFDRKKYRKYNIPNTINAADDYETMKYVIKKRMQSNTKLPDLIIIDGGKAHYSVVEKILPPNQALLIAICKGDSRKAKFDKIFCKNKYIKIKYDDKTFNYIQMLRDEAHKFAITNQRRMAEKKSLSSELLQIPGIGEKRKKELLKFFGSIEILKDAKISDIEKVPTISKELAKTIKKTYKA